MALTLALGLGLVVPPPTQASEGGRPAVASDGRNEGRNEARSEGRNEARSDARHEARGEVKGGQRRPREAMSSDDAIEQLSTRIAEKLAVMRTGPSSRAVEQPRLTVRTAPPASATTSGAQGSPMTRPVRSSYDGAASAAEVARTAALANGQPVPSLPAPARDSPAGWTGASLAMAGAATGPLTAATATPAAALAAAHRRASGAGPSAAFGAADPRQWSYAGERGPEHWATLDPAYASCGAGTRQSPIDIRDGIQVDLAPIAFDYKPSAFRVIDTGHTIQVNVTPGNTISVMGRRYELQHFHFRKPSEERVAGRLHDMSAHLVHKDGEGRVAVIAVLIERGGSHPVIQSVWNHLPLERHTEVPSANPLDVAALLPAERGYWTYMGSLTTPPCTEGVLWMVMKQPVQLSEAQIGVFGRLYPMNARPIQQSFGRRIMESN